MQNDNTRMEDLTKRMEDLTKIERTSSRSSFSFESFRDYKVVMELPAKGAEADNYLLEKNSQKFFLKLYRKGIKPDINLLKKLKEISKKYEAHLAEIIDVDYDENLDR